MTLFLVFPLITCTGLYYTFRLSGLQLRGLREGWSLLFEKKSHKGISSFGSITAMIAGNFGTGNITGMAIAFSSGGPGALVWMWIMAFLGSIIQYVSCILGGKYRYHTKEGTPLGGPMYVLSQGAKVPLLGGCFALFTLFGAFTVGNFAQVHSIAYPLVRSGFSAPLLSVLLLLFVSLVFFGGLSRFAQITTYLVPIKALLYTGACLWILLSYAEQVPQAFYTLFSMAVRPPSSFGGIMGYGVGRVMAAGFDRGLFATDAGIGVAPILQAETASKHPVALGLISLVAPLCVMVVCTMTGLVLLVTGAWEEPSLQSTEMVLYAFQAGLGTKIGGIVVMASLVVFSYTTILSWGYCGEKAWRFLFPHQSALAMKMIYLLLLPVGVYASLDLVWSLADLAILCMLLVNLFGIIRLSKEAVDLTSDYFSLGQGRFIPPPPQSQSSTG